MAQIRGGLSLRKVDDKTKEKKKGTTYGNSLQKAILSKRSMINAGEDTDDDEDDEEDDDPIMKMIHGKLEQLEHQKDHLDSDEEDW